MKSITIIITLLATFLIGCASQAQNRVETHSSKEVQIAEGIYITEDGVILEKEYPVAITLCGMPMAVVTHNEKGTLWVSGIDMMEVWGEAFSLLLAVFLKKMMREKWNILPSLPQGRNVDRHHIDPVEEILAEASHLDFVP